MTDAPKLSPEGLQQVYDEITFLGPIAEVDALYAHIAALEAERDAAYARGLEDAAKVAEAEPEVPGPMPDRLRVYDAEHIARVCVAVAKRNIAAAIRALAGKGEAK